MIRALVIALALLPFGCVPAPACDLALILASDVSSSMEAEQKAIVRKGTADALRQPDLAHALAGMDARIMALDWATGVRLVADWTPIRGADDLHDLALAIENGPAGTVGMGTTQVGMLLYAARAAFEAMPCDRMVLDIASDGEPTDAARSADVFGDDVTVNVVLVAAGANALTIMQERVRHGFGGFVMPIASFGEFPFAIRRKLMLEVG